MRALGLDVSLSSTGWAAGNDKRQVDFGTIAGIGKGPARLVQIRDEILVLAAGVDMVFLEGYAYARENVAHQLGEIGGQVRVALWEARIPFVVVAPATLKVYATGSGKANKNVVFGQAVSRLNYQGASHDESDALWLLAMCLDASGHPLVSMPENHRRALTKLNAPERRP